MFAIVEQLRRRAPSPGRASRDGLPLSRRWLLKIISWHIYDGEEVTGIFDYEPAQAIKSRKAILERVATDRVMVMGYHFPFPAIGHVVRHDTAYHWEAAKWAW